jgi:hypothetical protein
MIVRHRDGGIDLAVTPIHYEFLTQQSFLHPKPESDLLLGLLKVGVPPHR